MRSWRDKILDGWMDGLMHTQMDEGHFYSLPPPTSGEKIGTPVITTGTFLKMNS